MPPEGTDLILPSNVPHGKRDVLVLDSFDVETFGTGKGRLELDTEGQEKRYRNKRTDCWDSSDDLAELELVQNSGLTSGVETNLREDT